MKMEATNRTVNEAVSLAKTTSDSIKALEVKVDENDAALRAALAESEARIMAKVEQTVQGMVLDQLRSAGFDPDLSAGALTTLPNNTTVRSYASIAQSSADSPSTGPLPSRQCSDKCESNGTAYKLIRREEKFWECRRSLRIWPVPEGDRQGVVSFLKDKIRMDDNFLEGDLGKMEIKPMRDPRAKIKDEVIVTFETKEIRDAIKANAANLANFRDEAGMHLHLPNNLQKDFKALMSLSYDLKKKNAELRRNIKFDEDDLGLYMDFQIKRDSAWKRVKPEQARKALTAGGKRTGPAEVDADELTGLLESEEAE